MLDRDAGTIALVLFIALVVISAGDRAFLSPRACFSLALDGLRPKAGVPVRFENCSRGATKSFWEFGDGTCISKSDPEHVFSTSGTYLVTLTILSSGGEAYEVTRSVEVFGEPPTLDQIIDRDT